MEPGGGVEPGFERVADAFVSNFADHGDVGAAVAVLLDGRPVVDLWAGDADPATGRPWDEETIVTVFSCTKGVTAICVHLLVERGVLDPDEPVASYWPDFAAGGKAAIPLRWVMSHQAGLAAVDADLTLDEVLAWDPVVTAIAAQRPNWEPGTASGYHVRSYGWILGEVIRRTTGRSAGTFFREELGDPLDLAFWIGLPDALEPRCATLVPSATARTGLEDLPPDHLARRAALGPGTSFAFGYDESWNSRPLRAAEMPSSNGIGDARSLARLYALTVGAVGDRPRLLGAETIARATERQNAGTDLVIGMEMPFGLGFMVDLPWVGDRAPNAFGHGGAGGSLAFADPDHDLGFGYVMNQLQTGGEPDVRSARLVASLYDCLT